MRTRKIRGEDNLFNSISIAEREEEEAEGIADDIRFWNRSSATNMAQRWREKSCHRAQFGPGDPARGETGSGPLRT
jgi:hypothetical protein